MRQAINEQVGVIALELKKADAENATKAGQDADSLRAAIADVQANLGTLANQFVAQLQRVEFEAKEEAKKLQLIPGPAGAAGASLNPRGTFVDGETYNRLDVVTWLGSSYIAAVDGVKEKPSKNSNQWQVLASRGSGGSGGAGDFGSLAGVAQINQGGTGQTTRAAGLNALLPSQTGNVQYMLLTDGAGNVSWGAQPVAGLPSQTGNSGELLTTDGINASWSNAVTVSGSNATVAGTLTVNGALTNGLVVNGNGLALNTAGSASVRFQDSGTSKWWIYKLDADSNLYFRDMVNGRMQMTLVPNATSGTAISYLFSNLVVESTAASTTTSTGALVVGNGTSGGLGVGGAINAGGTITSTASTDSGVLQLNLVNSSTGTSASSLFRFNMGTRTASLQAYNDTHATLAGQLRIGTSNGDIVMIPSGVASATFNASTTTLAGTLTVNGGTASVASANGTTSSMIRSTVGGTATTGNGIFSSYLSSIIEWQFGGVSSDSSFRISSNGLGTSDQFKISSSGNVSIPSTQASSSTISGALIVSGGVGIAKRIHSGEGLTTGGDNETQITFVRNGTISIGPTSAATPKFAVGGGLQVSNTSQNIPAWGDVGAQFSVDGAVLTDTSSSGTVSRIVVNSLAASALAASSVTTYTQAATLFISNAPTANTNVTITHRYALYTAGGRINFQGLPTSAAGLQAGTLWNDAGTLKVA
jgi:hypothetical protein